MNAGSLMTKYKRGLFYTFRLLDNDRQIHALVDRAIELECARGGEWSNGGATVYSARGPAVQVS